MRDSLNLAVCLVGVILLSLAGPGTGAATENDLSDEQTEAFLLNARVVRIIEMLPGSTYPIALELEMGGRVRRESDQLISPEDWKLHLLDHS